MIDPISSDSSSLLLSSVYQTIGEDGLENNFLFGPPNNPFAARSLMARIFFRHRLLIRASLFVRKNGPAFLGAMAVSDVSRMLRDFVVANFGFLAQETFSRKFDVSYYEAISEPLRQQIAELLAASQIFQPSDDLTVFPLVPIKVEQDFWSASFFLVRPTSLLDEKEIAASGLLLQPEAFPPQADWQRKQGRPGAWLGIRSPVLQSASKMKAAILGAVALTPHGRLRHLFSGRVMFGGLFTLKADGSTVTSIGEQHTPAMSQDIVLSALDHRWMEALSSWLSSREDMVRRQLCALEYFYRAWPLDARARFAWLFMSLDALFGDQQRATAAAKEAMEKHGASNFDGERLRLLLRLRNSVIHGGAPDVYDSDNYYRYYEKYGDDPILDLEQIVARCLRTTIFDGLMIEHPDPDEDLIRAYKEKRRGNPRR